jgi:hypothetical protein
MTDLEIDRALALAIGWQQTYLSSQGICVYTGRYFDRVKSDGRWRDGMRLFSHRDWNVIGPIAARYDCFPVQSVKKEQWASWVYGPVIYADTPQRAIALAVIRAKK